MNILLSSNIKQEMKKKKSNICKHKWFLYGSSTAGDYICECKKCSIQMMKYKKVK